MRTQRDQRSRPGAMLSLPLGGLLPSPFPRPVRNRTKAVAGKIADRAAPVNCALRNLQSPVRGKLKSPDRGNGVPPFGGPPSPDRGEPPRTWRKALPPYAGYPHRPGGCGSGNTDEQRQRRSGSIRARPAHLQSPSGVLLGVFAFVDLLDRLVDEGG